MVDSSDNSNTNFIGTRVSFFNVLMFLKRTFYFWNFSFLLHTKLLLFIWGVCWLHLYLWLISKNLLLYSLLTNHLSLLPMESRSLHNPYLLQKKKKKKKKKEVVFLKDKLCFIFLNYITCKPFLIHFEVRLFSKYNSQAIHLVRYFNFLPFNSLFKCKCITNKLNICTFVLPWCVIRISISIYLCVGFEIRLPTSDGPLLVQGGTKASPKFLIFFYIIYILNFLYYRY